MKNTKVSLPLLLVSLFVGSFSVQASETGNGPENVEHTQSYKNFISHQSVGGQVQSDDSVFQQHDSNN